MSDTEVKTGIFEGMSFADYAAIPALNNGVLQWGRVSALHLHAAISGELERADTDAMRFGRALHVRLLEPGRYKADVAISMPCAAILKSGDRKGEPCGKSSTYRNEAGEWLCGTHGKGLPEIYDAITSGEAARIECIAASLKNHPGERLRIHPGKYEVVLVGEILGLTVKCRLDKWMDNPRAVLDVKKVAAPAMPGAPNAGEYSFSGRIASMGYGCQAALYLDVLKQLTGHDHDWYWLAVEDGPPYGVAVYKASDATIAAGRAEYLEMLHMVVECRKTGLWPGYTKSVETIDGPEWWIKRHNTGGLEGGEEVEQRIAF